MVAAYKKNAKDLGVEVDSLKTKLEDTIEEWKGTIQETCDNIMEQLHLLASSIDLDEVVLAGITTPNSRRFWTCSTKRKRTHLLMILGLPFNLISLF